MKPNKNTIKALKEDLSGKKRHKTVKSLFDELDGSTPEEYIRAYLKRNGTKGGSSKSEAKRKACKINAAKARAALKAMRDAKKLMEPLE